MVVGFEPDAVECARLNADDPTVQYVPVALGAHDGTATLHVTVDPACASLYRPIARLPKSRPGLEVTTEGHVETVPIARLDTWLAGSGLGSVDVMKLDTQGSELDVLRGAGEALASVRLLEIEVEFNPIYEGQPLFGDVDAFLRARGFVLWRIGDLAHYGLADAPSGDVDLAERQHYDVRTVSVPGHGGQLFWGHAYYVAGDIAFPDDRDDDGLLRDACAATAFGFTDLAASLLDRLRR